MIPAYCSWCGDGIVGSTMMMRSLRYKNTFLHGPCRAYLRNAAEEIGIPDNIMLQELCGNGKTPPEDWKRMRWLSYGVYKSSRYRKGEK